MKAKALLVLCIFSLLVLTGIRVGAQEADASNVIYDIRKFDEYTGLPFSEEKKRLDYLGIQLKSEREDMVGWYIIFGGLESCPGEARRRAIRAKNYIVKKHGIRADQIIWSEEGYREEVTVEIWIRPRSSGKPLTSNSPTVNKNEAQLGRGCKSRPYRRQQRVKPLGTPNNSFNRTRN